MLEHMARLLLAVLLAITATLSAGLTGATEVQPAPVAGDDPVELEPPEEVVYAARSTPDRIGRILAPVHVNGQGPFPFLIDTGASRSAIAPRLAARLGLEPDPTQRVILRGTTGDEEVDSIFVEELRAGDLVLSSQQLPVIAPQVLANAAGILGVEGLEQMCLLADFRRNLVSITRDRCPRRHERWIRIRASLRLERLVNIDAVIRSTKVRAIIDTGAERSLGNLALLAALSLERRASDPKTETQVIGATSHEAEGNLVPAPTLYLGGVAIRNMRVTFGDFNVFGLWGLDDQPAIVVGMDVLGTVDALMIDYKDEELRILPRGFAGPYDRGRITGSRIP